MVGNLAYPAVELRGAWKLAVEQQVGDLEEGALGRELLDRVSPVLQDAGVTVEKCDCAPAGGRIHEGRVVRHQPKIGGISLDLAQVYGADRAVANRKLIRLPGPVVGNRERFRVRRLRRHPVVPSMRLRRGGSGVPSVREQVYLCAAP